MIVFTNPKHFASVAQFAAEVGGLDSLIDSIKNLDRFFGRTDITARVSPDTVSDPKDPNFRFAIFGKTRYGMEDLLMHGGIIYSGPGRPCDGSAPNFAVSLDPDAYAGKTPKWSIHT